MCRYDDSISYYRSHLDADFANWYCQELKTLAKKVEEILDKPVEMTNEQQEDKFLNATHCHICEKPFEEIEQKFYDHCHLTGKFRAAVHNSCNLNYKISRIIPIVFHNPSGYNGHY